MKKLLNGIQKIDAKHLFLTGGASVSLAFIAVLFPDNENATWFLLAGLLSAGIFAVLIAVKMATSVLTALVTAVKHPRSINKQGSSKNIPLILIGVILLLAITSLRSQIGGGFVVSIIQVCALMIILYGFGMSWTRKKKRHEHIKSRATSEYNKLNPTKKQTKTTDGMEKPDAYGAILLGVTVNIADGLRKKHHLTEGQESNLVVRIMGFCFIILMRELQDASVQPHKSREFISEALRTIAKISNPGHEQDAYTELNQIIGTLSREYGGLPLSNAGSDSLKGTLLWEYSKLMNETMGKDKSDIVSLMENVSVITNINQAIDTKDIVKSLRFHY